MCSSRAVRDAILPFALLVSVALPVAASAQSTAAARLTGSIVDGFDDPVSGAVVSLWSEGSRSTAPTAV